MFPQFGATTDTLTKASSLVLRIGTDAHLYDDPEASAIAPLLDSKFDSEKCEALKRLLAQIAQGFDVSNFFPQVVKNVASHSLEVKKLVYLYLLQYAKKRPNEALLSINYFQKDLSDSNPLVRAWALRAMAGIRLHVIAPLVLVAISKCAKDPSPYVRKCAANALPKLYDLNQEQYTPTLEELVSLLLSDHSPGVIGAAASAFSSICPDNLQLIGKHFKKLCETLPDVEEWGQIVLIEVLLRYVVARHGLVKDSIIFSSCGPLNSSKEDASGEYGLNISLFNSYLQGTDEWSSTLNSSSDNSDVQILLQCTSPLLWSQNSAVVLAACGVHWIMASCESVKRIIKPIIYLLRSSQASKYVVLCNIHMFVKTMPSLFEPYFEDFFICSSDSHPTKTLKLEILSAIATDASIPLILQEFQDYIKDSDRNFAAGTVTAIGLLAQRLPRVVNTCLERLLVLARQECSNEMDPANGETAVVAQALISIKSIIEHDPISYEQVIIQLIRSLDKIKVPTARAIIIWMVGEYCSVGKLIPRIVPTVLKYLAWSFKSDVLEAKLQILNTNAKVILSAQDLDLEAFKDILQFVLQLAKTDLNYDIRDRANMIEKLLSLYTTQKEPQGSGSLIPNNQPLQDTVVRTIFCGKSHSGTVSSDVVQYYLPGSLSQIVFHSAPGYRPLPKPCSLVLDESSQLEKSSSGHSLEINESSSLDGSLNEEDASNYSSQDYSSTDGEAIASSENCDDELVLFSGQNPEDKDSTTLIHLSNASSDDYKQERNEDDISTSFSSQLGMLMSDKKLVSWLDEQPTSSQSSSSTHKWMPLSSTRISIRDVNYNINPQLHTLLDPTNGNGLKVDYSFSSNVSSISLRLVYINISFQNCSKESLTEIFLGEAESHGTYENKNQSLSEPSDVPILVPCEIIESLEPEQTAMRSIHVQFHHHLLPLKLIVHSNGKKYPVKLYPDIGYFVKPLPMELETFKQNEAKLPGMFEYTRRCTFMMKNQNDEKDAEDNFLVLSGNLASRVLTNTNVFLVSVDMPVLSNSNDVSGLCVRFSCEILSNSFPCLITITVEGKFFEPLDLLVKVNCEETVFGLNFLNRIVSALSFNSP